MRMNEPNMSKIRIIIISDKGLRLSSKSSESEEEKRKTNDCQTTVDFFDAQRLSSSL